MFTHLLTLPLQYNTPLSSPPRWSCLIFGGGGGGTGESAVRNGVPVSKGQPLIPQHIFGTRADKNVLAYSTYYLLTLRECLWNETGRLPLAVRSERGFICLSTCLAVRDFPLRDGKRRLTSCSQVCLILHVAFYSTVHLIILTPSHRGGLPSRGWSRPFAPTFFWARGSLGHENLRAAPRVTLAKKRKRYGDENQRTLPTVQCFC